MTRRTDREAGVPYYALGGLEAVPKEQADLCERRVGGLATWQESRRPLRELLANAYWLGCQDTVEMYTSKGLLWPDPDKRDVIEIGPKP
jgi:hypothetical protein